MSKSKYIYIHIYIFPTIILKFFGLNHDNVFDLQPQAEHEKNYKINRPNFFSDFQRDRRFLH